MRRPLSPTRSTPPAGRLELRASLFASLDWEDEQMVPALGLPGGTEFNDPAWCATERMALLPLAESSEAIRGLQVHEIDESELLRHLFDADTNH